MARAHQIITATKMGDHALRLIGTTDIDGNGTSHEVADVDPIVLFDFVNINTSAELPFRPHPHVGLTAMSFLPVGGTWMSWDSIEGDCGQHLQTGGLYFVHAGTPAFHHEFPSPDTVLGRWSCSRRTFPWSHRNKVACVCWQANSMA